MHRTYSIAYIPAALGAIVGAVLGYNWGGKSEVFAVIGAILVGAVCFILWRQVEKLISKLIHKGAEKVEDVITDAYHKHQAKKNG